MRSQTIVCVAVLGLWNFHSTPAHEIAPGNGPEPLRIERSVDLSFLEQKPELPVSKVSIEKEEELPRRIRDGDRETIYFKYRPADCCSCWLSPDICGGGFYIRSLNRFIARSWVPLSKNAFPVRVKFRVAQNGKMSDLKITECKNKAAIKTIEESFRKASPFPALPALGSPPTTELELRISDNPKVPEEERFSDTPLGVCLNTIQTEARRRFKNPYANIKPKVTIKFDVGENGELGSFSIEKSSGHNEFDSKAIETLRHIKKVPLSERFPENVSAKICFDAKTPVIIYFEEVQFKVGNSSR